ncbi:MAG: nuclease [Candidatus Yonathbacteria bacterium CG_4_10_14_0_8_um_filter_43_17]|uniref:Nuclease n=1 Tax=Candidatus Yonathbacteria bacterium CG_4_10_14_0_8_um_filter_43_17 TaxID=1975099 RepID=A0A2M7Q6J1_9BACT|nr:MAG: nuclease [Candidatus Yonathbacteria bacterium CG_4_10_14_0_8_um_filter_43_17]
MTMGKMLIWGIIVVLLILAGQDKFFDGKTGAVLTRSDLVRTAPATMQSSIASSEIMPVITRVVDGDTIVVLINGVQEKVRLIGVDTPEIFDPRGSAQCFGEEASAFTKSLLESKFVRLEADASQDDRDRYGRLLRYVFLDDDTLINQKIIFEGYGHEYTYRRPYKYQTEFKNAEKGARESQKGLWGLDICNI